jgi:restriction system protein
MPIPDFQSLMLPLLELAADGREHSLSEARDALAARLGVSEEERAELLPSGRPIYDNRVAWAKTYLQQAGLLNSSRRAPIRQRYSACLFPNEEASCLN